MPPTTTDASRISFIAEYYDPQAGLTRTYQFFYCESDSSVEMHDMKLKRIFLKRCPCTTLTMKEVFLGATVTVYGRQLHLVDYADAHTRNVLANTEEETVLTVAPEGHLKIGEVLSAVSGAGLRLKDIALNETASGQKFYAISAQGTGANEALKTIADKYKFVSPCSYSPALFDVLPRAVTPTNTTICLVKPHVILTGQGGEVVQRIVNEGFDVVNFKSFNLGLCDAEDFFEVYKGVVPEYKKLVEHVSSGPCWAIELKAEDSVAAFRAVCGTHDPEVCRVLFPNSIRAQYGKDRALNAVHCTDLPEESGLEAEFWFTLMLQHRQQ